MTSDPLSSPLLSVKQVIPRVRPGVVPRSRLEDRLESEAKLTVVVAPAGWGKTSLLSAWAMPTRADTRVAWVSLDDSDDEPVRFWSYVLAALRRVSDQISSAAYDALPASGEGPMAHALPLLLNELAETTTNHVLVLDDYHVISDREIHESMEFLVSHLPPTLRVVISSRADPPLPLARMRVRGELAELRADDLRFSLDESTALLSTVSEADLDPQGAAGVWERAEGWAAGLQLAGLTLRGRPGNTATDWMGGDDRHLFDYFTAEVFPTLAPRQRDLLKRAAPLELLSGSLCDAALDVEGSAETLVELERADLFVVAVDHERVWYRCHRLMRDALVKSPETQAADSDEREVLRRAAHWFEQSGRIDEAVRHLLSAGDPEAAAGIMSAQLLWFLGRGRSTTFLALGERLPQAVIGPQLALNLAYAADGSGQMERVVHWLDVAERGIDDSTVLTNWRSPRAAVLLLRAVMGTPASESALSVALCEEAVALERAAGTDAHQNAFVALGGAYGLDGRFEEAVRILSVSRRERGQDYWASERALQVANALSLFLLALGRDEDLDRLLAEAGPASEAAEREWGAAAAARVVTLVRLVQGRRSYQRGNLTQAAEQLAAGLALANFAARPTYVVLGLVFLADLELASGHRGDAQAALARAREIVDNDPITPFVVGWLGEAEARIGRGAVRAAAHEGALFEELTDREMSILRMLPGSATQREIGSALFLSVNTVKAYNKSLYRKLAVGSRAEAVRAARNLGLI